MSDPSPSRRAVDCGPRAAPDIGRAAAERVAPGRGGPVQHPPAHPRWAGPGRAFRCAGRLHGEGRGLGPGGWGDRACGRSQIQGEGWGRGQHHSRGCRRSDGGSSMGRSQMQGRGHSRLGAWGGRGPVCEGAEPGPGEGQVPSCLLTPLPPHRPSTRGSVTASSSRVWTTPHWPSGAASSWGPPAHPLGPRDPRPPTAATPPPSTPFGGCPPGQSLSSRT